MLLAEEKILELVHARIGEQQRRVVNRYKRCTPNYLMALAIEEVKKTLADLTARHQGILP